MSAMETISATDALRVSAVPFRLEPFGEVGWSVAQFTTAAEAARFVARHPNAAMPCWRRFAVESGELVVKP